MMHPGLTLSSVCLSVSLPLQQEVLPSPFARQTVRRAHGLRSAAHSTLFTQPPTALPPQVSVCVCVYACEEKRKKQTASFLDVNNFCGAWPPEQIHSY